jgi:hypothetical protein
MRMQLEHTVILVAMLTSAKAAISWAANMLSALLRKSVMDTRPLWQITRSRSSAKRRSSATEMLYLLFRRMQQRGQLGSLP